MGPDHDTRQGEATAAAGSVPVVPAQPCRSCGDAGVAAFETTPDPSAVPGDARYGHRDDVAWVRSGPVTRVLVGAAEHVLNPTAAAIWHGLDGSVTVDELVTELVEESGAPEAVVAYDVRVTVARFAALGLVTAVPALA